jgi:surface antigen
MGSLGQHCAVHGGHATIKIVSKPGTGIHQEEKMSRDAARLLAPPILLAFALTACASAKQTYRENPKAVLGSLIGAAAGAGIAAAAGGDAGVIVAAAAGGALLGGVVGHKLDDRDKRMAAEAAQKAFETNRAGQASTWRNPDSGNSGSVTPTRTYQLASGQYCRQYTQNIEIGGETHQTYGTACRQADGTWKIES